MNPKLNENEIAKQIGYQFANVKRYRNDINIPSPYRIQSNTKKRKQKVSNDFSTNEHEPKVKSIQPKRAQKEFIISDLNTNSIKETKILQKVDPCMRILKITINI